MKKASRGPKRALTIISNPRRIWNGILRSRRDKSAHNEIRDFYAHMARTHERLGGASQGAFDVIPEISLCNISYHNKKVKKGIDSETKEW